MFATDRSIWSLRVTRLFRCEQSSLWCRSVFGLDDPSRKARVDPLRHTTIPRLELMAALVASRLARTIVEEFKLEPSSVTFWSDSTIVLSWLRNLRSESASFLCGITVKKLNSGPPFLSKPETEWPSEKRAEPDVQAENLEKRRSPNFLTSVVKSQPLLNLRISRIGKG